MAVVLTGRRSRPFQKLIGAMLRAKSLDFDLMGLRPDPDSNEAGRWTLSPQGDKVEYHNVESVFASTMNFKKAFLLNILKSVPSIRHVTMWDDRAKHVKQFDIFLKRLRQSKLIQSHRLTLVPPILPKYDPQWEIRIIRHILSTHLYNLENPKNEGRHESVCSSVHKELHPLVSRQLVPLPSDKAVVLHKKTRDALEHMYGPMYYRTLARLVDRVSSRQRWRLGAEQPVFSGLYVFLEDDCHLALDDTVTITITAHSRPTLEDGMVLRVDVKSHQSGYQVQDCLLPLWYKPSEHHRLKRKRYKWDTKRVGDCVNGKVDTMKQYGLL